MAHRDTSRTEPGHRRSAGLWAILSDQGQVLVVQPSYRPAGSYQLVGGSAHPDEPPHLTAIREGREETGLHMVPDTLLITDYVPRNKQTSTVEGTNLVFLHRWSPATRSA